MSRLRTSGLSLIAGTVCGIVLVVACGGGPQAVGAQTGTLTCTVPPVTCNVAAPGRSSLARAWALSGVCDGILHLAGTDAALTGAWNCRRLGRCGREECDRPRHGQYS